MDAASGMKRQLRRGLVIGVAIALALVLKVAAATLPVSVQGSAEQEVRLFRIGTGGTGGTYYPIGSTIARALTERLGLDCPETCPPARLLAVAQASNGSVANAVELAAGRLEAALVQADIAHWAYTAGGVFSGRVPLSDLRAIARLYPESLHIVARADSGIRSLADLRDKRVSLDEQGSGTLVAARLVLEAHGLSETEMAPVYLKPGLAIERLRDGKLDAFFALAGAPVAAIAELAEEVPISLIPLEPAARARIAREVSFFGPTMLAPGVYRGTAATPSLEVGALLLTRADLDAELIYRVTSAFWHERTGRRLVAGHARGAQIRRETALHGLPLPLHPGAARFYREVGLLEP